ncbi:MAG TPA: sigma-70 family RNA polymerase sigma factor, partial [Solirubrobacteraceae bacterium]|nr:sigma-70 family RNA polymerase sigma factor [Solirubrobacteraceae bacterium]
MATWREYRRTGERELRDRLIFMFMPMVRYIVYRKVREVPAQCDVEDFLSCGLEALIHSIERYDPDKGATLEQYAWTRIHGAVLDELRRHDWAPRSLRRDERAINNARESFVSVN